MTTSSWLGPTMINHKLGKPSRFACRPTQPSPEILCLERHNHHHKVSTVLQHALPFTSFQPIGDKTIIAVGCRILLWQATKCLCEFRSRQINISTCKIHIRIPRDRKCSFSYPGSWDTDRCVNIKACFIEVIYLASQERSTLL